MGINETREGISPEQLEFEKIIKPETEIPRVEFLDKKITPLIAGLGRIGGTKIEGIYHARKGTEWDDVKIIRSSYEHGINFFDTAELYGWWYGESLLGTALINKPRESYVVATKIFRIEEEPDIKQAVINKALQMRERLGIEQLDLLYLHEPYEPLEEYIGALDKLVTDGVTKSIGLSRFNLEQVKRAEEILGKNKGRISTLQVSFSLAERRFLPPKLQEHCKQNNITVAGFRPLLNVIGNESLMPELEEVAEKYEATSAQIAIAWVRSHNVLPIARSHNTKHMEENIAALNIQLNDEDVQLLDNLCNWVQLPKTIRIKTKGYDAKTLKANCLSLFLFH